ncbi:MAG: hypothetical protein NUV49_00225 [Patescibacteria group bacterium]|nr:hypothetical protein [Patescibacteria group bacterium]
MDKRLKIVNSFITGAIVASVFIAAATIGGELYKPFKDWLAGTFYHHWVGKGVLAVAIFLLVAFMHGLIIKNSTEDRVRKHLFILLGVLVVSSLSILLFFLYEFNIRH